MYSTVKTEKEKTMSEDAKTFTQADLDALKAEHTKAIADLNDRHKYELDRKVEAAIKKAQAEAEEKAKEASMSELERTQKALEKANRATEDFKIKYELEAEKTALTAQREQALKDMAEAGVDASCLDFVFIAKDVEGTKARIKAFKEFTNGVEKATFEKNIKSTIPGASGGTTGSNADINNAIIAAAGLN